MAITPQVGRDFETAAGNRATVKLKYDKPQVGGILFAGSVKLNGDDQAAFWNNGGICPDNANFNLDSLWPVDDSRQYQPITKTDEGIYRALATYYAEIGSLRHDWLPKGVKYALKLERDNQGLPTAEIVDLEQ